ncbi:SDR family NAD(P)-dependent oxidoreductase [Raoultella sp. T31]|uniref:SDR family NAD(P)-dependent oxidoreductase n=1 Tax=Raoultella sp. T31 TaxID=2054594 RepID=UPI000C294F6E|nr:oxidoreductase [Raoultella sp. T31]
MLKNKVAIITGAAGGVGQSAANSFYIHGAYLVLVDLNSDDINKVTEKYNFNPERILTVSADVRSEEQVKNYVKKAVDKFGKIDIFFNNAGIIGRVSSLTEASESDFDLLMDVNVKGVFWGLKHILPVMIDQKFGSVINTASMAGLIGFPSLGLYTASKHAVVGLTRAAALEVAGNGVRVNAICPGPVNTKMMRKIESGLNESSPQDVQTQFSGLVAMNRYADPEEIAQVAMFLASENASYITGSIYTVDGGMTGM